MVMKESHGSVRAIEFTKDDKRITVRIAARTFGVWDVATGNRILFPGNTRDPRDGSTYNWGSRLESVRFSPDGKRTVSPGLAA